MNKQKITMKKIECIKIKQDFFKILEISESFIPDF